MKAFLILLIRLYRLTLSPFIGQHCRFQPTCSRYTEECIREYGALYGSYLGAKRILRCHPWAQGGYDPPPARRIKHALACAIGLAVACSAHIVTAQPQPSGTVEPVAATSIETPEIRALVSPNRGGSLVSYHLKGKQFQKDSKPIELVTTSKPDYLPMQVQVTGPRGVVEGPWQTQKLDTPAGGLVFTLNQPDIAIVRKLEPGKNAYQIWSTTQVINKTKYPQEIKFALATFHYVKRKDEKGGMFAAQAHGLSHGLCLPAKEKLERITREDFASGKYVGRSVKFSALENMYFVSAMAVHEPMAERCYLRASDRGGVPSEPEGSLLEAWLQYPKAVLASGESKIYRTVLYTGPKKVDTLTAAGHSLKQVVDLGFFSAIAGVLVDILAWIHRYIGNWGLAIILLTLLVKAVLYPLTEKSFQSMARIRQLKPELDRINELYAGDREKKGMATMELYRKYKINPFGGCLPQLFQLPIWWALYTSLSTNVELYNAPFALWWSDLASPDPFYVLPLTLGALMFVQQRLTPSTMDPAQAKVMMYMMPAMITVFMLFLPAGLCLYMVTNSVLGIAQQKFIEVRLANSTPTAVTEETQQTPTDPKNPSDGPRVLNRRTRRGRA